MKYGVYLTGAFGQSKELYRARNEAKRNRGTQEAVEKQISQDTATVVKEQKGRHFSFLIDPMFSLFDLLQPLREKVPGIEEGSQENWFNNNCFYRKPYIHHRVKALNDSIYASYYSPAVKQAKESKMAILPSPYTVYQLSDWEGYKSPKEAIKEIAEVLRNEAVNLKNQGFERIQIDEPTLAMKQSLNTVNDEDLDLLRLSIEALTSGVDTHFCLHCYFGNVAPLLDYLLTLPVNGIGVDCTETKLQDLEKQSWSGKDLTLGLINSRSPSIEDPQLIAQKAKQVAVNCQPNALYVTPNTGTEYIGWSLGHQKLNVLETVGSILNNEA